MDCEIYKKASIARAQIDGFLGIVKAYDEAKRKFKSPEIALIAAYCIQEMSNHNIRELSRVPAEKFKGME
jgi:hypothetical protein